MSWLPTDIQFVLEIANKLGDSWLFEVTHNDPLKLGLGPERVYSSANIFIAILLYLLQSFLNGIEIGLKSNIEFFLGYIINIAWVEIRVVLYWWFESKVE